MNPKLTEAQRRPPVTSAESTALSHSRPPNPLERIALRVGIALIIWSRRQSKANARRNELIRRHQARAARDAREREYRRRLLLTWPRV
jgi:hypothetical protein